MQNNVILVILVSGIISLSPTESQILPLYVGIGYDLATGNPHADIEDPGFRSQIFEFTFEQKQTTEDGKFLIPDRLVSRNKYSCAYSASAQQFSGVETYQNELKSIVSISSSGSLFLADFAFSASTEFSRIHNITSSENRVFITSGATCESYSLEMPVFDSIALSSDFKTGVLKAFKKELDWIRIIEVFGTSFIYSNIMGGRTHLYHEVQEKKYQELESINIDIKLAAKYTFAKWSGDINTDFQEHTNEIKTFESKIDKTTEIYIGGKPPKSGDWKDWQELVYSMPAPISYSVASLSDLFTEKNFPDLDSAQLKQMALDFNSSLQVYCTNKNCFKPDPDKPFPPKVTKENHQTDKWGGDGGSPFTDLIPDSPMMSVRKILIRHGDAIDQIQLMVSDGVTSYYTTGHGGMGGGAAEWEVPESEFITQIEISKNYVCGYHLVSSLMFITNKGTRSPVYGRRSQEAVMITLDGYLVSLYGNSGSYLDSLGFISVKIVYPNESLSQTSSNIAIEI